ncbi:MAG: glycosyltransferase [Kiritimatiellia bacterium]
MYVFPKPDIQYLAPWESTFEQRLLRLCQKEVRVAYYYSLPDNSTFRYRVHNMIEVLNELSPDISAAWFSEEDFDALEAVFREIDLLVICRVQCSGISDALLAASRRHSFKTVYDIDDGVFDPSTTNLVMQTLDQPCNEVELDFWTAYITRHGEVLKQCDSLLTTNRFLARKLHEFSGKPATVIPNFINSVQAEISHDLWHRKRETGFARDHRTHIGYFSGSPTHNRDFQTAASSLAHLLKKDPGLTLRIVGFLEIGPLFADVKDQVEFFPFQNFLSLQILKSEVEINIVPLQENDFTHCKSELKFFEAAAVGTMTVASPTYTYQQAIRDGENGFLSPAHQWVDKLQEAIHHIESWPAHAPRVRQQVFECYHWQHQLSAIENSLTSLLS